MVGSAPARADTKGFLMSADARAQRTQIRMAMAVAGLMMAHQVAGKASRDAIFLSQFRTADLPAMVTAAAIAAIVASIVGSRTLVRLGPQRVAPVAFALSSLLQLGSGCCSAIERTWQRASFMFTWWRLGRC